MLELNKVYLMDCLEGMAEIPDKYFDVVIADPPYNIGKAHWDNISGYIDWVCAIFKECERVLKDNGTFWYFHMKFGEMAKIHAIIEQTTRLRHKQLIVINKGLKSVVGKSMVALRSYPRATEYLQFYTFDDPTGAERLGDEYARINPMAQYLKEEIQRARVTNKSLAILFPSKTGGMTGCVSNWLLGLNFPTKEQYSTMRAFLNRNGTEYLRKEYDDLRKEYDDLRKEYEGQRYTFNLEQACTDVWDIDFYKDDHWGHPTSKPISLIKRIIESSTEKGGIVLDPFMGSGSTAIAAISCNREYMGFEIDEDYYKAMQDRIYHFTRQEPLFDN